MAKFLWTQRSDFGPGPRVNHAMAFDSKRGRIVLFGGIGPGNAMLGDTWQWDGSFWTQMDDIGPAPRMSHAMVYDSARQVSLLFGGYSPGVGTGNFGDTWEWDGQDWTQLANSGPIPRNSNALAFDSGRNRTVLFGGFAPSQTPPELADTWEFDGQDWTQQADTGPQAGGGRAMAFDSTGARVILFDPTTVQTWSWDGASWSQISEFGPSVRASTAMTIRFNDHIEGDGAEIFAHACKLGFEGIVSKDRMRPYRSGPSKSWVKIKNLRAPGVLRFEDRDAPA